MALTPARRRTTTNSAVLRPNVAENAQGQDSSDADSIVTEQASTAAANVNDPNANQAIPAVLPPANAAMDSIIPRIPEPSAEDILAKFPYPILTKIEGEPTYAAFFRMREEITQNTLVISSPFGGGQHGHWGSIADAAAFQTAAGVAWNVPASVGVYPVFPDGSTGDDKRRITKEFVRDETGIKTAETVERLLNKQVRDAIEEDYYLELEDPVLKFSKVTTKQILDHIRTNYAVVDDHIIEENRKLFDEDPDLSQPIDVYFKKQERCKQISVDGGVTISEKDMVVKMQLHMGKTGLVSNEYTTWCAKAATDRTWTNAKKHFRKALKDQKKISQMTSAAAGLSVNATMKTKAREDAKAKISEQLGVSFDNLAMAAQAKAETIDDLTKSVAMLTAANDRLTKTNQDLVEQVKMLKAGGGNSSPNAGNRRINKAALDSEGYKLNGYCWTCGYKVKKDHHSSNCQFMENPGHQKKATRFKPMGGSNLNAGFGNKPDGTERN